MNKFEHGETAYLPVTVTNTEPDHGYNYRVSFNDFVDNAQCSIGVGESQIKTAEEVASIFNPSGTDWESKYHEAEAKIAELKEALEKTRDRANEAESTLADYRYIFEYMPEWRERILHELCISWRADES